MSLRIAVIGSGLIGSSWAMVFARAGSEVALYDPYEDALERAGTAIARNLVDLEEHGLVTSADAIQSRIEYTGSLEAALAGAAWVQENALEDIGVKRPLFGRIDQLAHERTIIASSTSAIPCQDITDGLAGAHRMLVAHPANPPYLLPIVELSGSPATSETTMQRARAFFEEIGMAAITIAKPVNGFVLNRLQVALLDEAFKLIEDGVVSGEDLDKTLKHGLGLRWSFMGPMETIDLNAPGGIRDYLERFGPSFGDIAAEQSVHRPWNSDRYARLEADRRTVMAQQEIGERTIWRDRRLMALSRHKQDVDTKLGT